MSSLLLHICCGPCFLYPFKLLKEKKVHFEGFFYNPNIHPSSEYMRRKETLKNFAVQNDIKVHFQPYELDVYFNSIKNLAVRCFYCYEMRMEKTAKFAVENGFESFSTTLLYSKRQKHEMINEIAKKNAEKYGIKFYYHDFREGWKWGIEESKRLLMYRQNYCGCIFSEKERFYKEYADF